MCPELCETLSHLLAERLVMGSKEGTYRMEHWVLNANNESWNTTTKTNDVLYGD